MLAKKLGKKGGIYLKGPPNVGKSLLVKMISSLVALDEIGTVSRAPESRFWLDDIYDKALVVAEEYIVNDIEADQLKLHLEGHELATSEKKNGGKRKMKKRQPWLITSNFELTCMCPRHSEALMARLIRVELYEPLFDSRLPELIHNSKREELGAIARRVFIQ